MFFFSNNKPILKDLIPENYIDIHSHLLPNIDDGAQNFQDTVFLIERLKNMGMSEFITTPHIYETFWNNSTISIQEKEQETISNLRLQSIEIPLKAAAEYFIDDHFIELFKKGEILTLKDNYVLVEISYLKAPINIYNTIFDLQVAGYRPVLAHPERYSYYHKNFNEYLKLKDAGCLFQLNLLSTVGYYGEVVFEAGKKLLNNGLIDFVGSDVHHKKHVDWFDKKVLLKDLSPLKESISANGFFSQDFQK
ncbi:tyrosine-protein phosphatase [Flavobacterium sp.]|uniref:tyrosine-protein phosphatase n=1 Tax=Flavobacterium sp. TaxID=239 RepID=UPI003750A50F